MFSRIVHAVACVSTSFLSTAKYYFIVWIDHISFIYPSVVSIFWLLRKTLLWQFVCKFLCGCMFSFPLGTYLGVELLSHVVTRHIFRNVCWLIYVLIRPSHRRPDICLDATLDVSVRAFLDEMNIWICRPSKADGSPGGGPHPLIRRPGWKERLSKRNSAAWWDEPGNWSFPDSDSDLNISSSWDTHTHTHTLLVLFLWRTLTNTGPHDGTSAFLGGWRDRASSPLPPRPPSHPALSHQEPNLLAPWS